MKNGKISRKILSCSIIIVLFVVFVVVIAFYVRNNYQVEIIEEELLGGSISLTYSDDENLFAIENAIPTSDVVGEKLDSAELFFDFTVKTEIEDAEYIEYEFILIKDDILSTSIDENIKVYLEKEKSGIYSKVIEPVVFKSNVTDDEFDKERMSVYKQKKVVSGSDNYRLRLWVSDTAVFNIGEVQNFGVSVAIKGIAR